MVWVGGLGWWFGFLGFPHERDCFLGVPLESQTTGPQTNHQLTIGWYDIFKNNIANPVDPYESQKTSNTNSPMLRVSQPVFPCGVPITIAMPRSQVFGGTLRKKLTYPTKKGRGKSSSQLPLKTRILLVTSATNCQNSSKFVKMNDVLLPKFHPINGCMVNHFEKDKREILRGSRFESRPTQTWKMGKQKRVSLKQMIRWGS